MIRSAKRTLYDIDFAIKWYIDNEIQPQITDKDAVISIPVIFANGEKWDKKTYHEFSQHLSQEEREQAAEALGERIEEYMEKLPLLASQVSPLHEGGSKVSLMEGDVA